MTKLIVATVLSLLLVTALALTVSANTMLNSPGTAKSDSGQTLATPEASEQAIFLLDNKPAQTAATSDEDGGLASSPGQEREVTTNPAGKEIELPTKAQAPERNPLWNGGALGQTSGLASEKSEQGQTHRARAPGQPRQSTINPAGHGLELPAKAQAPEKNPVWGGKAPGHTSESNTSRGE